MMSPGLHVFVLSINECRRILLKANPNRTWTDHEIERLRDTLYGIAELAFHVLPAPSNNTSSDVQHIKKAA